MRLLPEAVCGEYLGKFECIQRFAAPKLKTGLFDAVKLIRPGDGFDDF